MDPVSLPPIADATQPGTQGVPRLEQPQPLDPRAAELRRLRQATGDFESIFLSQLLKPLEKSLAGSHQGETLGSSVMLNVAVEKLAESLADAGGVGLGDILYESMKNRVVANPAQSVPDGAPIAMPERDRPIPLPAKAAPPRSLGKQNSD